MLLNPDFATLLWQVIKEADDKRKEEGKPPLHPALFSLTERIGTNFHYMGKFKGLHSAVLGASGQGNGEKAEPGTADETVQHLLQHEPEIVAKLAAHLGVQVPVQQQQAG